MRIVIQVTVGIVLVFLAIAAAMFMLPLSDHSDYSPRAQPTSVSVVTLGDYGTGDYRQRRVAAMLEANCRTAPLNLIQTVGDNFYPEGVSSTADRKWQTHFESMYNTPCLLQTPFMAALGNHDYGSVPDVQVQYGNQRLGSGRWSMPARYYVHSLGRASDSALVTLVVLDTMDQLDDQLALIDSTFSASAPTTWRVVVGHHNVRTYSEIYQDDTRLQHALLPALKAHGVHLYLSGHSHNLQLITAAGEPVYIISGGGGKSPRAMAAGSRDQLRFASRELGFVRLDFDTEKVVVEFHGTSGRFLTDFSTGIKAFEINRQCIESGSSGCTRAL